MTRFDPGGRALVDVSATTHNAPNDSECKATRQWGVGANVPA